MKGKHSINHVDEHQLNKALVENEFCLFYQPKLVLSTGKIVGAEALIRWIHPERGIVPPLDFIPIAEETGFIIPIGEWVIRNACEKIKEWQNAGLPPLIMAVNLSGIQLYEPNLVNTVQNIIEETEIDPKLLEFEITESMMMDVQHVLPILRDLKSIGVQISLDDFGTGYSSLYYLKEFPIDKIKIDQGFVRNCTKDSKDATIVKTIIAMAHQLKIDVIAEGIETKDQLVFLQQNVCNIGQGYLFSKPLNSEDFYNQFYEIEQIVERVGIPLNESNQKWLEEEREMARQDLYNTLRQQQGMIFKITKKDRKFIHTLCDGELLYRMNLIPEQIIGKELHEFLSNDDATSKLQYYERAWNGEEIMYEGQINGVWYLASLRPISKGGQIVEIIGSCIEITERIKMVNKLHLRESINKLVGTNIHDVIKEDQLSSFINDTGEAICIIALNGNIEYINPAFIQMFGWKFEDLIGQPLPIIPPFELEKFNYKLQKTKLGMQMKGHEISFLNKTGKLIDVILTLSPLRDGQGRLVGVTMMMKDITHERNLEIAVKENENRYRKLVELSTRGHIIHKEGMILDANPAAINILKEEHLIGKSLFSFLHPEDKDLFKEFLLDINLETRTKRYEMKMILGNGEMIDIIMAGIATQFNSQPATLVVFGDVSERKKSQLALKASEKRYRELVEHSPEAIIVYKDNEILYGNPSTLKLLGVLSSEELISHDISNYIHPDSIARIEKAIHKGALTSHSIVPLEERLKRKTGEFIDIEVSGLTIEHDDDYAYLIMFRDITIRKQNDIALRKSEEKYRLIAENMTDLICIIDWEGHYLYASPSHQKILGIPPRKIEGIRARNWMHNEDFCEVRSQLDKSVITKEDCVVEFRYRNHINEWIWLEGKATPIFHHDGSFNHFLIVSRDITERKQYEQKLSYMAYHDMLTGLPNRRYFNEKLEKILADTELSDKKFALVYIDLDNFKTINDTWGHEIGDELLIEFSSRIQSGLKSLDTFIFSRLGGDEFTLLIKNIKSEHDTLQDVQQVLNALQLPWHIKGVSVQLSASIGMVFYPKDGITKHDLMKYADRALYIAKDKGKNNIHTFSLSSS